MILYHIIYYKIIIRINMNTVTVYVTLMSGEVMPYICKSRGGKVKYLSHRDKIKEMIYNHLKLDLGKYIVKLLHDDDDEKLKEEQTKSIQKLMDGVEYDDSAIRLFKERRDKNRYYENGSVVRAFIEELNLIELWNEIGKLDKEDV